MLKAAITGHKLTVSGAAARAGQISVSVQDELGVEVRDDDSRRTHIAVAGSQAGVTSVDFSALTGAGAILDTNLLLSVIGSAQADELGLGHLNDTAHGGSGDDVIDGGAGNDKLYGELGDDVLYGRDGNDRFQGSKGDDLIDGGAGDDIALYSGKASDYRIEIVDGVYRITDLRAHGLDGIDTVANVERLQFSDGVQALASSSHLVATLASGTLAVTGTAASADGMVKVFADVADIGFSAARVTDDGSIAIDAAISGSGHVASIDLRGLKLAGASVSGADDPLSVIGSAQADTITLGARNDTAQGQSGDDLLIGNAGNDRLYGNAGDDNLLGGSGDDRLQGSGGHDHIDGGAGTDLALYSGARSDYQIYVESDPAHYFDGDSYFEIHDRRAGAPDGIDSLVGVEHLQFKDGILDLTKPITDLALSISATKISVSGSAASSSGQVHVSVKDSVTASDDGVGSVTLVDHSALDRLTTVDLSAIHKAGVLFTTTHSGSGVKGSAQADEIHLADGGGSAHGGSGDDVLIGGPGQDKFYGDAGDDRLDGGAGNDKIDGGDGSDTAIFTGRMSDYHITVLDGDVRVADLRSGAPDGIDHLYNVEHAQFSDGALDLAAMTNLHG